MKAIDEKQDTGHGTRATELRRALLAKIHIAKKALGLDDGLYRLILQEEFGVESSAQLTSREMGQLVARFESKGWQVGRSKDKGERIKGEGGHVHDQCDALRERVGQMVLHSDFTPERLRGLTRKICRVDDIRFCRDAGKLKRLIVVLGRILEGSSRLKAQG